MQKLRRGLLRRTGSCDLIWSFGIIVNPTGQLIRSRSMPGYSTLEQSGLHRELRCQTEKESSCFSQSDGTLQAAGETTKSTAGNNAVEDFGAQHLPVRCDLFSVGKTKSSEGSSVTSLSSSDNSLSSGLKLDVKHLHSSEQLGQDTGAVPSSEVEWRPSPSLESKPDLSMQSLNSRSSEGTQRSLAAFYEEASSDWEVCTVPTTPVRVPAHMGHTYLQDMVEEGEEGLIHISAGQCECEVSAWKNLFLESSPQSMLHHTNRSLLCIVIWW